MNVIKFQLKKLNILYLKKHSILMVLEKKLLKNFGKLKLIKLPQDIFNLDYKKIENLRWMGKFIS